MRRSPKIAVLITLLAAACAGTPLAHVHTTPIYQTKFHVDATTAIVWTPDLARAVDRELDVCFHWWVDRIPAQAPLFARLWAMANINVRYFPTKEAAKQAGFDSAGKLVSFSSINLVWREGEDPVLRIARLTCHELGHAVLAGIGNAADHELMWLLQFQY